MAQNITLLGASYTAVPAVTLPKTGGGTAQFDDTTDADATAADITAGKTAYVNGVKVEGTGSGGGGVTRENIVPQQTITASAGYNGLTSTAVLIEGADYEYTVNGETRLGTAVDVNGTLQLGDGDYYWYEEGGCFLTDGSVMYFRTSAAGTYTVKVDKITLSGGGGGSTLIEKTITANGTYNAEDDNADGYSSVTVNVSGGGASNVVTGTFKGTTTGEVLDVNVNYSGSGYPIAIFVVPIGGMFGNTTYNSLVKRYAIGYFSAYKTYVSQTPTYMSNGTENEYSVCSGYKNSSSAANNYSRAFSPNIVITYGTSADPSSAAQSLLFRTNKKFSVIIAGTSYGFAANIEYTYWVIYSS